MLTAMVWTSLAQVSRLSEVAVLPGLPFVRLHEGLAEIGYGQEEAHRRNLQGRVLWIDGTANISRTNSREKIESLLAKVADVGFNTIVYDVKPIIGYTLYPSRISERLVSWKGEVMPADFDPLAAMIEVGHAHGLSVFVALNAFSEGHLYAKREEKNAKSPFGKPGWGYEHPELQTVQYVAHPFVKVGDQEIKLPDQANIFSAEGIGAFTQIPAGAAYHLTLNNLGDFIESGGTSLKPGQSVLAAKDEAGAEVLREAVRSGYRFVFSSRPSFVKIADHQTQIPLMLNPHDPRVQRRAWSFAEEIASRYQVDGLLYDDRLRFGGLNADFSDLSKTMFERRIGKKIKWPDDVYRISYTPALQSGIKAGKYFDAWLAFRSQTMMDWVAQTRSRLKAKNRRMQFGIYAGSWYGEYPQFGTNYGSPDLSAGFPFLNPTYRKTGLADLLDLLITGCYYKTATIDEAAQKGQIAGQTIEAAGILSNRVAGDRCWVYAGIGLSDFEGNPEGLGRALQAACGTTQGVMVFDLSHNIDKSWPIFARAFGTKHLAPHMVVGSRDVLRKVRLAAERRGWTPGPFPLFEGAAGTGF